MTPIQEQADLEKRLEQMYTTGDTNGERRGAVRERRVHQQKIEEYRQWLDKEITETSFGGYTTALIAANSKFNELFPEDTQTLSDHLDKIPGMDGEYRAITIGDLTEDETDNLYPR